MLTGAQILMESLTREGVEIIFGFPGGALYDIYDELSRTNIRHILVRHEAETGGSPGRLSDPRRPALGGRPEQRADGRRRPRLAALRRSKVASDNTLDHR